MQEKTSIALFKNKYKKEEKHPDYVGSVKINGEYKEVVVGWKKMTKPKDISDATEPYISMSFKTDVLQEYFGSLAPIDMPDNGEAVDALF